MNSLDYAEIDEELYGSLKRSSLFVKSIGADMDTLGLVIIQIFKINLKLILGLPKAVWQFGEQSINAYNQHTPSEMGFRIESLKKDFFKMSGIFF